jgi:ABC-type lipoprotein release transport system permease subunit
MPALLAVAYTGLIAVLQYPLRSVTTIACLVAVLFPYLAGMGLSQGLQEQAEDAVRYGADLYVTAEQLGRAVPLPTGLAADLREIDGVTAVIPRIVAGFVPRGSDENAVLVGLPPAHFPAAVTCVEGRLPASGKAPYELVLGTELARRLRVRVGDVLLPISASTRGEKLSKVVGIFKSDVPVWESNLILTSFDAAAAICDQQGVATELLVYCRPGYHDSVRKEILRDHDERALAEKVSVRPFPAPGARSGLALKVTGRESLQALVAAGILHRRGLFNLHFLLAFAVGILTILVTSGVGTSERRREVGLLKATGWQTDEVLLRGMVESLVLSLTAASLALILAFVWLRLLNGYWLASLFLAGGDVRPGFPVPFRLAPVPALLAFLIALALVMCGTLYSTWRAAVVPPREVMR